MVKWWYPGRELLGVCVGVYQTLLDGEMGIIALERTDCPSLEDRRGEVSLISSDDRMPVSTPYSLCRYISKS